MDLDTYLFGLIRRAMHWECQSILYWVHSEENMRWMFLCPYCVPHRKRP